MQRIVPFKLNLICCRPSSDAVQGRGEGVRAVYTVSQPGEQQTEALPPPTAPVLSKATFKPLY